jgi:UDP-N-acetylmuramate--alanine ligase
MNSQMNRTSLATTNLPDSVHLVGIGGVGMTGLALILDDFGVKCSGTDLVESSNTTLLRGRGIHVRVGHAAAHLADAELLVYSSAVRPDNPERQAAAGRGIKQLRRGDALAQLVERFPVRVAVAGSHGKTTVAAMLAHALVSAGMDVGYMVGGHVDDLPFPAAAGAGNTIVFEVDESDGSQAAVQATHAIVVNADDDHCWSVGGTAALDRCFRQFAESADFLLTPDTARMHELFNAHRNAQFVDLAEAWPIIVGVPGRHNQENALLALTMIEKLGADRSAVNMALAAFSGVDRRLRTRFESDDLVIVEDYAHHPVEVEAGISAMRDRYPEHRVRAVIEPHRFERVKRYAADFGAALSTADSVIVVRVFGAWLNDGDLASPQTIVDACTVDSRYSDAAFVDLAQEIAGTVETPEVLLFMGAGDIGDLVRAVIADVE